MASSSPDSAPFKQENCDLAKYFGTGFIQAVGNCNTIREEQKKIKDLMDKIEVDINYIQATISSWDSSKFIPNSRIAVLSAYVEGNRKVAKYLQSIVEELDDKYREYSKQAMADPQSKKRPRSREKSPKPPKRLHLSEPLPSQRSRSESPSSEKTTSCDRPANRTTAHANYDMFIVSRMGDIPDVIVGGKHNDVQFPYQAANSDASRFIMASMKNAGLYMRQIYQFQITGNNRFWVNVWAARSIDRLPASMENYYICPLGEWCRNFIIRQVYRRLRNNDYFKEPPGQDWMTSPYQN